MENVLPLPCVCQKTPILPLCFSLSLKESIAELTPKYWWFFAIILVNPSFVS
jgi:hypothetical protein